MVKKKILGQLNKLLSGVRLDAKTGKKVYS